jgi:hypothetical protein
VARLTEPYPVRHFGAPRLQRGFFAAQGSNTYHVDGLRGSRFCMPENR